MPENNILQALANGPAPDTRPRVTYTVPETSRQLPSDPTTITLTTTRISDELEAQKVAEAKGTANAFPYELLRRAVVAVNGVEVDWSRDKDSWLDAASPKVRELALMAFKDVNENSTKEAQAFLASRQAAV